MDKCARAVVSGRVQGVYFRVFTMEEAERLQLCGWVRNLPGGDVEALFSGPSDRVDQMLAWLATGSPRARVDGVVVEEIPTSDSLQGFTIRH